ncbi:uncharacterized protein LOC123542337 [Mercenaria mercenaria]|uniref:uncharacterized protein LOC123542337 n=1 Tax=Mercenaria mercenaria TaxID=6596 RepID=UPI00234F134B|nr:uncharacterized protein LOC123542337 [Mercenaria mercenaria]
MEQLVPSGNDSNSEESNTNNDDLKDGACSTFGFNDSSWKTDFNLIVEGKTLHVSKVVLALASPVFDRMFQSDFKESKSSELELPGKKLEDVEEFLQCIYPSSLATVTCEKALQILPLIEEYQVSQLKPRCEEVLLEHVNGETSTENLFRVLNEACCYDLKQLQNKCIDLASEKPRKELVESNEKYTIPPDVLNKILLKVVGKFEEVVNKMEKINEDLFSELETLGTWKSYLSNAVTKADSLSLNGDFKWKGKIVKLEVPVKKNKAAEEEVLISDFPLKVSVAITQGYTQGGGWEEWLISNTSFSFLVYQRDNARCSIKLVYVIENRYMNKKSVIVKSDQTFQLLYQRARNNGSNNKTEQIIKYCEIEDESKGFLIDGIVKVVVHIFLAKHKI